MFFQPMWLLIIISVVIGLVSLYKFLWKSSPSQKIHWGIRFLAALLLLFAGLRPSVPTIAPAEIYNSNYEVYFVVDLTSSMIAEDWGADKAPRLDGVREDINNVLDDYAGARFSLITFNSTANLRVPLTPDSTAIASAANTMQPEITMYSNGSDISTPVQLLTDTLKESKDKTKAKIVLYFGDGEQTTSQPPTSFKQVKPYLTQAKVYGYGTPEGGRMKTQTGYYITSNKDTYIKDANGQDGISHIDETNLKNIAAQLGGTYEHRSADTRISVPQLTDNQKIALQKEDESSISNTTEYYWLFLIPFSLLMFVEAAYFFRIGRFLGVKFK